ncbi:DUF6089 family protein [Paraflavisolibacter sp. H34]|uniref:type IX secretion system protein PorG n=1 Tax=Huijunlia imazamoxiresistens TaxID=3127457 RepID=UPI0030167470
MRKLFLLALSVTVSTFSFSQMQVGLFGGISNYTGDLARRVFTPKLVKPAIGLNLGYELSPRVVLRGGVTFAKVAGDDRYNKDYLRQQRNLSFQSRITEYSLTGEFYTMNFDYKRWSPYVFAGLAVYRFNPYAQDSAGGKVYLRPLGTEGQGLPGYSQSLVYSRTQLALPFGAGVKFALGERFRLGAELGLRKLFTDYLDDVSNNYAAAPDLLAAKGPQAVEYAYRGDEIPGGNPAYPEKGAQRGSAKQKDWYYFTGLTLAYRFSLHGRDRYGCPAVQ